MSKNHSSQYGKVCHTLQKQQLYPQTAKKESLQLCCGFI
jgi:hypothetical protein